MPDDPTPTETPPAEPAAVETVTETKTLSSPWASDLQDAFQDPATQAQVDEFLRAQVQPYVTKLEQDGAENRKANNLWNDFSEYPEETFRAIAKEFHPDQYDELVALFDGSASEPTASAPAEEVDLSQYPEPIRKAVEYYEGNQRQTNWETNLAKLQKENPDVQIDGELLAPWVNVANGDMDLGLEGYKAYLERTREFIGAPAEEQQEPTDAPQVIGSSSSGPSTPPLEKKPESLDEAIDDFWEELKAKRAPQVVQA